MASTFKNMSDWHHLWWKQYKGAYPQFYLNHCCSYKEKIEISIDIDYLKNEFVNHNGKKVIALSAEGRLSNKQYPHADKLKTELENAGYFVWSQFDGSSDMLATLSRLHYTNLLITVPTATQWLAKLVDCPSLIIPGPLPPEIVAGELVVDQSTQCQYCFQKDCINEIEFLCMDIEPIKIVKQVNKFFNSV